MVERLDSREEKVGEPQQLLEVIVADSAGTCFGVDRAISLATEKKKPILGPLVHNPLVVQDLATRGIPILERYQEVSESSDTREVVITAHGYPKDLKDRLRNEGITVHDATCPVLLGGVYRHIHRFDTQGYHIFLVGNPDHAEIIASRSYAQNVTVLYCPEDVEKVPPSLGKTVVMCQTTLTRQKFDQIVSCLQKVYPDVKVMDTRCRPVRNQQEAVEDLAKWVDGMVVLGGYESSNTTNLARIASNFLGDKVWHVDRPDKITAEMLEGLTTLGITGGTSTPRTQIEEAKNRIAQVFRGDVIYGQDKERGGNPEILPIDE